MVKSEMPKKVVKILVVEDSPTQLEQLRFHIEDAGFSVVAATNGKEGLAAARGNAIDLVISDIVMPEMDGYELCKALHADEAFRHLPVILLTSLSDSRDVIRVLESGATNFIHKPYKASYLIARIQNVLATAEARKVAGAEKGLSIRFQNKEYNLSQDSQQVLEMVLATYEDAACYLPSTEERPIAGVRILVVEDSPTQAERIRLLLEECGCAVVTATNGMEGLAALRANPIDLVISDVAMREMDGYAFCKAARTSEQFRDLPIVLLAALTDPHDVLEGLEAGATNFICKPFDDRYLVGRVRALLAGLKAGTERPVRPGIEIVFADMRYNITADRMQMLDLLLSSYDGAVRENAELGRSREEMQALNEEMENRIQERTAALEHTVEEVRLARLAALNMMEDAVGAARALEGANRDLELQIAARRESEEALRKLATVVEQASESIVVTNTSGVIEYVNPAFERITGYTAAEAIGQTPRILKSGKQDAAFYKTLWSTITAGSVWRGHFVNKHKGGSLHEVEATISPVRDNDGTITHFVAIKRDVTQEVALGEQLRHAQKIEAIGTLAGGVAHDFNNLLQAMLSMVQLLKRKSAESPRNVQHLSQLEKTIRRGSDLTRQLLLFARREVSRRATLDLNQLLRDLMAFLHRVVRENIHLSVEPANVPLRISADRGQIEQVIMNLAVNAIDAMPEGGTLSIVTGGDENTAWLKVSDTGTGIPEAIRDRIFEPFFTTKEAGKGTGLGLSVVHGIVAAHEGRIDVECPAEGGTIFRVELPLQGPAAVPEPVAPSEEGVPTGRGERVLLVEDDQAAREGLSGILEMLGYSVVAVSAGEEAVAIDGQVPFSVVLTDSMLPGMPGIEVVRRLRERWPDIKVILMSGYAAPGVIEAAGAVSQLRFLQKPFDMGDLARTLRDVLQTQPSDDPERP